MYVVKYKLLLPRDVNPIGTHYVASELENAVKLIENINTYDTWRYETLSSVEWMRFIIYICVPYFPPLQFFSL